MCNVGVGETLLKSVYLKIATKAAALPKLKIKIYFSE
jgi:hypothetical protein